MGDGKRVLPKKERDEIVLDLIEGVICCNTVEEAAMFLQDLITESELANISRRLRIAKLLLKGKTYDEIREEIYVSETTVAKIAFWLKHRGEGFRRIIKKIPAKKKQAIKDPLSSDSWVVLKRRYPAYFLPERIIEQIIATASNRQKARLSKVLSEVDVRLKEKSHMHRQLEKLLR